MNAPDPELLRVLIAFAEAKNLIEAAEKLRISQPAVSQRLQQLQDQAPLPLYSFVGRKKVLTSYGQGLYELAKENFSQLSMGFENLNRNFSLGSQLVLRVGCRKEFFDVLSETLQFEGRLELNQLSDEDALTQLQLKKIDLALSSKIINTPELISRKIFETSGRLIAHKKWLPKIQTFRDLQKEKDFFLKTPCLLHKTETHFFEKLTQHLKIRMNQLNCKAVVEDWASLQGLVEKGFGYSIVPNTLHSHAKELATLEVPHAVIPRVNSHAIFHRNLRDIEAFQKALNFRILST